MKKQSNIALFVDIENFVGFCDSIGLPMNIEPIIDKLTEGGELIQGGKVTVRKSYGDIHKLNDKRLVDERSFRRMLLENFVQHEDIPYQNKYKNSADIRLVIDALDVAYTNNNIDVFVVVAEDKDFMPLFSRLRQMGKGVIGIGGSKASTRSLLVKSCDVFYYHENLCHRTASVRYESGNEQGIERDISTEAGFRLLVNTLNILTSKDHNTEIEAGIVVRELARQNPDFESREFGFVSFRQMCEEADKMGLVKMVFKDNVWHNLRLPDTKDPLKMHMSDAVEPMPVNFVPLLEVKEQDLKTKADILLNWIEKKLTGNKPLKISLPTFEERTNVYRTLRDFGDREKTMGELSKIIFDEIKFSSSLTEKSIFKILYSLYRGGVFSCSQGTSSMNPIIKGLVVAPDEGEVFEESFVTSTMKVYKYETGYDLDAETWSQVLYGTTEKADTLGQWIRKI